MSASPTHLDNIEIYLEMRPDGDTNPNAMAILFHPDYGTVYGSLKGEGEGITGP